MSSVDFFQSLSLDEIQKKTREYVLGTYAYPMGIAMSFGQGEYLYDTEGKQYIDFLCGISVTNLGHGDADIVEAIRDQAERLVHTSNLFYNQEAALLAEALVNYSFPGKVFFTNSGTEASEAIFKFARSYGQRAKNEASVIVTHENSFHGRSTAGMCMTGQEKIHRGFGPLLPESDLIYLPRNDLDILEKTIDDQGRNICAFALELVQGEGGIHVMDKEYVQAARDLCKENEILFIVDEVQTGIGRTGKLFAYEHYEIVPDAMSLAKALGNGFPIGALVIADDFATYLGPGQHGSTFGGNHLATRVAFETLKAIVTRDLMANVAAQSEYFLRRMRLFEKQFACVTEVRGLGLHLGMELDRPGQPLVIEARDRGLLVNCTAGNTIRVMPPLNISLERAAEGLDILEAALTSFQG
ncbi:MAG: aspartate aminotransferase family protein [Leptospirales bacterium]|jgi:acetylornithine/N-succinyldiaminopimelate aminotransferase